MNYLNEEDGDCKWDDEDTPKKPNSFQVRSDESPATGLFKTDGLIKNSLITPGKFCQWSTSDNKIYIPTRHTVPVLTPGVYDIDAEPNIGLYFERVPAKTEGLLRFPDSVIEDVLIQIRHFWERQAEYKKYDLAHKRGIILYGPPGSGKSSLIQQLTEDVINREGVVIRFGNPSFFIDGMRKLREIQAKTPVIVTMEDIDSTLERHHESEILNILDGIERVEGVVFVATTNYPNKLGARIINRPSRFDKRYLIRHPNAAARKLYFEYISKNNHLENLNLEKWVRDTKGFSLAHLKELFSDVIIFETPYNDALKILKEMLEPVKMEDGSERAMGFGKSQLYDVED